MDKKNGTFLLTKEETIQNRKWFVLDAAGKTLGRFASEVAKILRGKHKTVFTMHVDSGDGVIILNAEKVCVSGMKAARKYYKHYTGHIGGYREIPYKEMMEKNPTNILRRAVKGMMPKTRLAEHQLKRLRIFKGEQHDMQAQQPLVVQN